MQFYELNYCSELCVCGEVLHSALGGHFTKNTCFDPSGHRKNGKCIFYVKTQKTLVAKVVGLAKMHISTKNGSMVP
jgi:hypothetical protein